MAEAETDYLIIGAGAVGMAFADTLLDETDAHITFVDRHAKPGGHWNDAYPFVALHQPSAFYGVNSTPLGSPEKDTIGLNKGYYSLATGSEVCAYYENVMARRFLPSGRVAYHPMSDYCGDGRFVSILSGKESHVEIRGKTVDATYYGTSIPSTHKPKFEVAEGARMVPPNALPQLWQAPESTPSQFVILGAGKTAMDVGVWLQQAGAKPDSITWVRPRDTWMLNRGNVQPGLEFFEETIGGQVKIMDALAKATTPEDLFARLEADGIMLRLDPDTKPLMFHYPTISRGEVDILRNIGDVVRMGHVRRIEPGKMIFDSGEVKTAEDALYIDCTATAVERRPVIPQFQGDTITLQMIRVPQPAFSAALTAYIEANYEDDATKNSLGQPVPLPDGIDAYARANLVNMMNQFQWSQRPELQDWMIRARLDGFGKTIAAVAPNDAEKQDLLQQFRDKAQAAIANLPKLIAQEEQG
ncbi:NAD(P)-binding protein [Parasphingopyxis lamellibrachiae]|uniref:Putative NAD(P)-binding protein n=1 Tax=Parasphingopyxis lamellibrachiae TaxID=680125 RepID=A0A3D9FJM1_9SPHN|nr:NAD(P)-binding protein [Parasphingopyxis lamellibrachiae]RED17286.1 putative NAD(P)-binding protein [Parasphingopyxis lamellibrachiae]